MEEFVAGNQPAFCQILGSAYIKVLYLQDSSLGFHPGQLHEDLVCEGFIILPHPFSQPFRDLSVS